MTPILIYSGSVAPDGLHFHNRKRFDKEIQVFAGKEVEIKISKRQIKRSQQQNRYYWGAVVPIVTTGLIDAGYRVNQEDAHIYMKSRFLIETIVSDKTGEILPTVGSTTKLTTVQFMEYIAEVQQWAAEFLNVVIPDPNEQVELELK
jgi:hypothetical protein